MKKAVIYARVSDPGQLNGFSIDVQKELCAKWAKENNYQIEKIFEDGGKSATKTVGRDGLNDMIIYSQEKKDIDVALVIDTDRIARNVADHFFIKKELKKAGTKLIAVNQPMVNDTPEGKLVETILAGTNAYQSELTARKVRKSLEKKARSGWWPGWAPLGYLNHNKGTIDNPVRIIIIDEEKSPYIKQIFELYATGNYSVDNLVKMMYKKGLRSKNNKKVSRSTMYNILKNVFYMGLFEFKGKIYQGNHKPLISKALFDACQEITNRNNHNACRKRKYNWLLAGFAYCHECGSRFYASWAKNKNRAYYHGSYKEDCHQYVPVNELEEQVANELKKIKLSDDFKQRVINRAKELISKSGENRDSKIKGLRNKIKKLEDKDNVLVEKLGDGVIDDKTFKKAHNKNMILVQSLENEVSAVKNEKNLDISAIAEVLSLTNNLYQTYSEANFKAKKHYLAIFFKRIEVHNRKIMKIEYSPLFKSLIEAGGVRVSKDWLPEVDSNHQP